MILRGVLFTALLTCFVAEEDVNPSVPVARHLISRIKRQNAGGDPNLEGIFGQQAGNVNPQQFGNNGQSGSSNERPPFGFGFSGLEQGSSNSGTNGGGTGGFDNFGSNNQNQSYNQWSSGNNGGFGNNNIQGSSSNGGFDQGTFDNQGNQWSSGNNGGFGSNNNQGQFGSGTNNQNVQRPQTTQRTPLNQIALQTTISDGDCLRGCRNRLTQQYGPVCGSDSITYLNKQVFDCYKRECRNDVIVLYAGSCVTTRAPNH